MTPSATPSLLQLREALEASWDDKTSFRAVKKKGNPALGQCYTTTWLVQQFFPEMEIIKGKVWNGTELEVHFWNGLPAKDKLYHIDLTWQQFPAGSSVRDYEILDRINLGDGPTTVKRCQLLKQRVLEYLDKQA
jgi:hypothetical protein